LIANVFVAALAVRATMVSNSPDTVWQRTVKVRVVPFAPLESEMFVEIGEIQL
jgi:hypothetical protein